jgi:NADPH:quinone reductase-like Zn-dependent oxidoreductase
MPFVNNLTSKKVSIVALKPNKDLALINKLYETGQLKCILDEHRYALDELPEAMRYFGTADHKGKVVITVRS